MILEILLHHCIELLLYIQHLLILHFVLIFFLYLIDFFYYLNKNVNRSLILLLLILLQYNKLYRLFYRILRYIFFLIHMECHIFFCTLYHMFLTFLIVLGMQYLLSLQTFPICHYFFLIIFFIRYYPSNSTVWIFNITLIPWN